MTIVIGKDGKIVGTAHEVALSKVEAGYGGPIAGPGQSIRVIDLPKDFEGISDASDLHRKLKNHLDSGYNE